MAWRIDLGDTTKECSILGVMLYYANQVNKTEYPDFNSWKADMVKQGLLVRVEEA